MVLAGDLNSPGDDSGDTYNAMRAAGFADVWTAGGGRAGRYLLPGGRSAQGGSSLQSRIDLVLTRGSIEALTST